MHSSFAANLFRFLRVNIGLILQFLDLRSCRRIGDESRLASFPRKIRLEQLVSMTNALDSLPET